jgi:hypothetical protein
MPFDAAWIDIQGIDKRLLTRLAVSLNALRAEMTICDKREKLKFARLIPVTRCFHDGFFVTRG